MFDSFSIPCNGPELQELGDVDDESRDDCRQQVVERPLLHHGRGAGAELSVAGPVLMRC